MSLKNTVQQRTYAIAVDVPETLVEKLISIGERPPDILSELVRRMSSELDVKEIVRLARGDRGFVEKDRLPEGPPRDIPLSPASWNYSQFEDYMSNLLGEAERRASVADLISMLMAYLDTSSRPTSDELRRARGFRSGRPWSEELRTSKARLTINAKHMGLPRPFGSPYGSGLKRYHPMNQGVYESLLHWAASHKNAVKAYRRTPTPRQTE